MNNFQKIGLFLLMNAIGFLSTPICYYLAIFTGILFTDDANENAEIIASGLFNGILATWVVCAVFSFAYFFLEGKMKLIFLWVPAVIPLLYGLSVLYGAA